MFCYASIRLYRKIWNPIMLFYGMLIAGILLTVVDNIINETLKTNGFFWLAIGSFVFILAFLIFQLWKKNIICDEEKIYNVTTLNILMNLCLIFAFILVLMSLYVVMQIAGNVALIFVNSTAIRNEYLDRESQGTIFSIIQLFLGINFYCFYCLFPVAIKNKCSRIWIKLGLVLLIRLFSSLVTMSKELFLMDCVILISAFAVQSNGFKDEIKFVKKYIVYFLTLIVALLVVTSMQRGYTEQQRYNNYTDAVFGTIQEYMSVPIVGFSVLISNPSVNAMGDQCLRPIINVLSYLGLTEHSELIQQAMFEDINVYSMFGNMYNDFGFTGIIIFSLLFGFFFGLCFYKGQSNSLSRLVVNSIILMIMFFGYYDFEVIQTVYLFVMLYAIVFEKLIAGKLYK